MLKGHVYKKNLSFNAVTSIFQNDNNKQCTKLKIYHIRPVYIMKSNELADHQNCLLNRVDNTLCMCIKRKKLLNPAKYII